MGAKILPVIYRYGFAKPFDQKHFACLKEFNAWRRGEIEDIGYSPKQIGEAIDYFIS